MCLLVGVFERIGLALQVMYPGTVAYSDYYVWGYSDREGYEIGNWNVRDEEGNLLPIPTDEEIRPYVVEAMKPMMVYYLDSNYRHAQAINSISSSANGILTKYSFDGENQSTINLYHQFLLNNPTIQSFSLLAEDKSEIVLNRAQFELFYQDIYQHKQDTNRHFWNLKTQIENATTEEELDAIEW